MTSKIAAWLLLITNLPGRNATLRMRVWRALNAAGAGLLRDGVYVLPNSADSRRVFAEHAHDARARPGAGVQRWLHHLETLLEGLAANPQQAVSALPLLDDAERQRLIVDWNNTHHHCG